MPGPSIRERMTRSSFWPRPVPQAETLACLQTERDCLVRHMKQDARSLEQLDRKIVQAKQAEGKDRPYSSLFNSL